MTCQNGSPPLGLKFGNITMTEGVTVRGVGLAIGSPIQIVSLRPSTSTDYTWVYNAVDCKDDSDSFCYANYGGVFNSSKSRTYKQVAKSSWNGTSVTEDPTAASDSYIYFNDNVLFGNNGTIPGFPMVMRKLGDNLSSGLGLGPNSTFLDQAVKTGSAPTKSWGMWVGSRSITQPVEGALWIGGYDTNRVIGNLTDFTSYQGCETCLTISGLSYDYPGGSQSLFSNSSQTLNVNMQPWTRYLEVPPDIFANLVNITNATGTLRSLSNGVATFKRDAIMGNITVTLNNNYKTTIPASELFTPPRGPDTSGVYSISNNSYLITMVQNTTYTGYVLDWGIPFLTMNYLVVQGDKKIFQLGQARQGPASQSSGALVKPLCDGIAPSTNTNIGGPNSTNSTNTPAASSTPSKSSNVGAIAGGVVGGIGGLLLIAALIWFILRSKKRERKLQEERDAALAHGSEAGQMQERMSQYTGTSPTEVSTVYAGGKAHEYPSVNQWVSTQQQTPHQRQVELYEAQQEAEKSPPQAHATMNAPFEMPAYPYK